MDSDDRFWISVWALAAAVLVTLGVLIGAYDAFGGYQVRKLVEAGASPIEARCAIYGDSYGRCYIHGVKND